MTSYCRGCEQMTESIRKSRATLLCKVCGYDKTFGDLLQKIEGQNIMIIKGFELNPFKIIPNLIKWIVEFQGYKNVR